MSKYNRNPMIQALWDAKVTGEITAAAYFVGRALVRMADRFGRCWPSRATLAAELGYAESTIEEATKSLRRLGWLSWLRRKKSRTQYDSNLYQLTDLSPEKAKNAVSKEESNLESSAGIIGEGGLTPAMTGAFRRLAATLGASTEALLGGLGIEEAALDGTATG